MSNFSSNTVLLADKNKPILTKDDLFDRIINVRITVRDKVINDGKDVVVSTYTIRSDFEPVFVPNGANALMMGNTKAQNKYYIRKCIHKPSINFSLKRLTKNVGINLSVTISNFYIFNAEGSVVDWFNLKDKEISSFDVQIGYFGQFSHLAEESEFTWEKLTESFDNKEATYGVETIHSEVCWAALSGTPPKLALTLQGFVGIKLSNEDKKNKTRANSKINQAISQASLLVDKRIEDVKKGEEQSPASISYAEYLKDKYQVSEMGNSHLTEMEKLFHKLFKECLDIPIYMTYMVKHYDRRQSRIVDSSFSNLQATIDYVTKTFPKLKAVQLVDGSLFFCLEEELIANNQHLVDEMLEANKSAGKRGINVYDNKLPAVYSVSFAPTQTFVCPFFYFTNPFDYFYFESKYSTTDLVSYYAPSASGADTKQTQKFMIISQDIQFATVENINETTLTCIYIGDKK